MTQPAVALRITSDAARRRVALALSSSFEVVDVGDGAVPPAGRQIDVAVVDAEAVESVARRLGAIPVLAVVAAGAAPSPLPRGCTDVLQEEAHEDEILVRVAAAAELGNLRRRAADAEARLEEATRNDVLTGLGNRRHVEEHLGMAASGARRRHMPLSLLLVDVDHLKRINDAFGHLAGDAVLRSVASRVSGLLRGDDMAGRWAGDEILVVAPSTDADGAWRLGERIRDAVSAVPVLLDDGREVVVTVSVGCATGAGDDVDAQLRQAEGALDAARVGGRNRVVLATH